MSVFQRKTQKTESLRRRIVHDRPTTVFSYHTYRSAPQLNTGRHQPEKRPVWSRFAARGTLGALPIWLSSLAIVVAVVYVATLSTTPKVVVTADPGMLHRDARMYSHDIGTLLGGSVFNRSKVTISTTALESQISQIFPEAADVQVSVPLVARNPVVRIAATKPVCIIVDAQGHQYFVRDDGVATLAVEDAPNAPSDVIKVIDQSGLEMRAGQQVMTKDTTSFISQLAWQMIAQHIAIAQLVLPATPHELQMRVKGESYYVRFNTSADARTQAGTYLAVRASLQKQSKAANEYIDVRVDERAYYK